VNREKSLAISHVRVRSLSEMIRQQVSNKGFFHRMHSRVVYMDVKVYTSSKYN